MELWLLRIDFRFDLIRLSIVVIMIVPQFRTIKLRSDIQERFDVSEC
jgi:hypothetical protein